MNEDCLSSEEAWRNVVVVHLKDIIILFRIMTILIFITHELVTLEQIIQ